MTGFRIGPLDAQSKRKGTYLVGLKEEGKTIANRTFKEETVFVKKVSAKVIYNNERRELALEAVSRFQKNTVRTSCRRGRKRIRMLSLKVTKAKTTT